MKTCNSESTTEKVSSDEAQNKGNEGQQEFMEWNNAK